MRHRVMHHRFIATWLVFAVSSVPLMAQNAAYKHIDQKTPFANPNPPLLTALNLPRLGTTFQLQVPYSWLQRNRAGANYVLAMGLTNPDVPLPALGGFLFTSAEVLTPTPMSPLGAPGTTTMNLPVPNSLALIGFPFYQQVLETFTTSPAVRLSRGGHAVIGR